MSTGAAPSPQFPGHLIKIGSTDKQNVIAIQKRLNQVGCGPVDPNGVFGAEVLAAVELFQMRSVDFQGRPLAVDGEVGSMTWGALFGLGQPATVSAASRQRATIAPYENTVQAPPCRSTSPSPMPGPSAARSPSSFDQYRAFGSRTITGSGSAIASRNRR